MENKESGEKQPKPKAVFSLGKGLALSAVITGYILGPLLIALGASYIVYTYWWPNKLVFAVFLAIAFFTGNVLVFKKSSDIVKKFDGE